VFPKGKHDDQVDSTAQFLDWSKSYKELGIFKLYRMQAEELRRRTNSIPVPPDHSALRACRRYVFGACNGGSMTPATLVAALP
jgi:hypothetical protein